jgi:predicted O-methyltransferase YrrM
MGKQMSVEHALTISGWMSQTELQWLADRASGLPLVVEFGSWFGRSSVAMTTATRLFCVDTWQGSNEHSSLMEAGANPFREWWKNLCAYPNATPLRMNLHDSDAVDLLVSIVTDQGGADMVFVDASHDYESVRRDLVSARRLLKPGGILCGHDYCDYWSDVMRAVNESCNVVEVTDTIWQSL